MSLENENFSLQFAPNDALGEVRGSKVYDLQPAIWSRAGDCVRLCPALSSNHYTQTMSTSRPNILKIFCAIKGSDSPFLVSIDRRKKVANLEKKIIKYNQDMLKGINVTDFTLYQVDLPIPIQTPEGVKQALQERAQKLNPEEALCSLSELSTIYTSAPPDGAVHIIAQYSPRSGYLTNITMSLRPN